MEVTGPTAVGPVGPVLTLPGTPAAALVPVTRDGRAVGAFVLTDGRVRYRALPDPDRCSPPRPALPPSPWSPQGWRWWHDVGHRRSAR